MSDTCNAAIVLAHDQPAPNCHADRSPESKLSENNIAIGGSVGNGSGVGVAVGRVGSEVVPGGKVGSTVASGDSVIGIVAVGGSAVVSGGVLLGGGNVGNTGSVISGDGVGVSVCAVPSVPVDSKSTVITTIRIGDV